MTSETIHSRSYTHIIRAIVNEPGVVFDGMQYFGKYSPCTEGIEI
jgi:ribonucleotide reductase beta subunit family protein with ferritin-like domain